MLHLRCLTSYEYANGTIILLLFSKDISIIISGGKTEIPALIFQNITIYYKRAVCYSKILHLLLKIQSSVYFTVNISAR